MKRPWWFHRGPLLRIASIPLLLALSLAWVIGEKLIAGPADRLSLYLFGHHAEIGRLSFGDGGILPGWRKGDE